MRGFLDSLSIEEAGRRVEGLDLRNNTAARDVFIHVAIEYSRGALRKNGIDLLTIASYSDVSQFSRHWLASQTIDDTDLLLIALAYWIQVRVTEFVESRNAVKIRR